MGEGTLEQLSEINMSILTIDLIIALAVLSAVILFVYTIGKDYSLTIIFALYMAIATMTLAPFVVEFVPDIGVSYYFTKIGLFTILLLVFSGILAKNGFSEPLVVPSGWESAVFAVAFSGLFLMVAFSFIPSNFVDDLSPIVREGLMSDLAQTIWPIAPAVLLLVTRGRA
ncbi:MAG: hypothetical protein Q8P30_00630 [Candidatus Uhrbacteria bacterium]|nr:hypothetical protein [Candidatus Uhrbacteria bacterium]